MQLETIADIKLAGRAINEDWPVSTEHRSFLVDELIRIARAGDPELSIAAAKVVLAADALNAKKREAERKRLDAEHARKLQLIELAVKLGIARHDGEPARITDRVSPGGEQ